ncbi:NUDIX domain-containing protein [Paenibacillus sp. FJAT-26967]|uniref:NUDIX domain-containing protein n=1 Tax=Paenibacillus sp. FJAT-26967 TaxID=1729690 RepID=UPI00346340C9
MREAREEAGIELAPDDLKMIGVMHRKNIDSEWIDVFLTASSWQREIVNKEPHKCEELFWHNANKLPANMVPFVRKVIEMPRNGMWFASFGWPGKDPA